MNFRVLPLKDIYRSYPGVRYIAGILAVVISGALWGSGGIPVRISYAHGMTPLTLALFRATIASIIMGIFTFCKGRKDAFILRKTDILQCLISGLFGVAVCNTAAALAMGRIPVGLTFVLINTAPFWVIILARIFWNERVTRIQLMSLMVGIFGIWVAVGGVVFQSYNLWGVTAALSAGFGYAVYVLNGKHAMGKKDPFKAYIQMFFWGALCLWMATILTGQIRSLFIRDREAWLSVLYITLFSDIGGYAMLMLALRIIPGGVAAIVSMTEIPFSMLLTWIFLGEIPLPTAITGGMLIIGAVILLSLENISLKETLQYLIRARGKYK